MSKPNIRKITVDPTKCNTDSRRPSVFERLGTKPAATSTGPNNSDYCRNWALNGSCSYGKNCKYANTHTLISPSKRAKKDNAIANATTLNEDPFKRLTSKIVKTTLHSPDLNLEEWNQTDLEYEDEKVLERRRQFLQRELELQMKKDKEVHGKDKVKHKKKAMSSSSSSRSSSTSSSTSSSSTDDSTSSSTSDSRKKSKKIKSKRHQSVSSDCDEEKERKKRLKLKRLGNKNDKLLSKKKRKVDIFTKDTSSRSSKKFSVVSSKKHSSMAKTKSPAPSTSHTSSSKIKERNRSESPRIKFKEADRDKHCRKIRDADEALSKDVAKGRSSDKVKEVDKSKNRPVEERNRGDDKSKQRSKDKEKRSRTPPLDRVKHQHLKESTVVKAKQSRTPDKSSRSKRDSTPSRYQDKSSCSSRSREVDRKDRDSYKQERGKDKEDGRKGDQSKSRPSSSQDSSHRKNASKDFDDKSYAVNRNRQRSKERRDKDYGVRDERSHSRLDRDQRDSQREKEREEVQQERCRDRQRDQDREKDSVKTREREIPPLMGTAAINPLEKSSRYGRDKDRFKEDGLDKGNIRDRRSDREKERSETKPVDRERGSQRFDVRYDRPIDKEMPTHKMVERDRTGRFPRDRSADRMIDKGGSLSREHLVNRETIYERDRHNRRFNVRCDRGHPSEHDRKEHSNVPPLKIDRLLDRRDSPRHNIEMDRNFDRGGYVHLPSEHWEEQEEPPSHLDYRSHHSHEEDRRKSIEPRRYNSPFDERRPRDERPPPKYTIQNDRTFEDLHHPLYGADKIRSGAIRDEGNNDNWEIHRELEHGTRDRTYAATDWEEREWRTRHSMWDKESLPHSETHDEEWAPRYDNSVPDWKVNDARKWDNQLLHVRGGPYRNDRIKELDLNEPTHSKRRMYGTPELREECSTHDSKQGSLHNNMKEESINKKLMELAEGRLRRSREKSVDSFQKRMPQREKSEAKETSLPELKRPCLDESLQTLHTESDLSDISDDPDDILNMDEEDIKTSKPQSPNKCPADVIAEQDSHPLQSHEGSQLSPKESTEEVIFTKEKENNESAEFKNVEDENMETMDFEEISDGELEEDIKTSGKGLGDALGVDWESLVKESQPRRSIASTHDTAQSRWQCKAILRRIGISAKYAGTELMETLTKKYDFNKVFLDNIALLHTALVRKHLVQDSTQSSLINDDLLYRNFTEENDEDNDPQILKPCISLYEEAKTLLEQAA